MKKLTSLVLSLTLLAALCACAAETPSITAQEIYDANTRENLLRHYDSVELKDSQGSSGLYLTKDYSYDYSEGWTAFLTDEVYFYYMNGSYGRLLMLDPETGVLDLPTYRAQAHEHPYLVPETVHEKVTGIQEKAEGTLVTTLMDRKTLQALDHPAQEQVEKAINHYLIDPDTKILLDLDMEEYYTDGTQFTGGDQYTYNGQPPQQVAQFLALVNSTDPMRTMTVVIEPDTEKEKTVQFLSPKGLQVSLGLEPGSEWTYELFADRACTQAYVPSVTHTEDSTMYLRWIAPEAAQ